MVYLDTTDTMWQNATEFLSFSIENVSSLELSSSGYYENMNASEFNPRNVTSEATTCVPFNNTAESNITLTRPMTNATDSMYDPFPDWWEQLDSQFQLILPVMYSIIFVFGFVGNLLVILVLLRFSSMKTLPNIYILNLSIADFLFMLTIPFLAYQQVMGTWIFGAAMCKIVMAFDGMNQFTGVFLLTAMSLDRYVAFVHPMKSLRIRTVRTTRIICVTAWLLSTLICLPLWLYTETFLLGDDIVCYLKWPEDERVPVTFLIYACVLGYAVPLIIIAGCYCVIYRHVIAKDKPESSRNDANRKGSRRVAILVIVAVVAFAVCWFPFYALQLYYAFFLDGFPSKVSVIFNYSSICLSYANSAINPIIYTFVGRSFKENILRLLRCQGRSTNRSESIFISSTPGQKRQEPTVYQPDFKYNPRSIGITVPHWYYRRVR
ncbi:somatostatin receptor type 5-like [Saccoglossus kowalevskii]|uniref:Somatostatin receptor type 5-like n=1 Tax=Saccoglossus kowalevskii TaxID=10224 RepID=A0ABM0GWR7_SACKO|nr:PREDICTED: somatostatin receptor type 5-like [Saccoglossus kowalevskii]